MKECSRTLPDGRVYVGTESEDGLYCIIKVGFEVYKYPITKSPYKKKEDE